MVQKWEVTVSCPPLFSGGNKLLFHYSGGNKRRWKYPISNLTTATEAHLLLFCVNQEEQTGGIIIIGTIGGRVAERMRKGNILQLFSIEQEECRPKRKVFPLLRRELTGEEVDGESSVKEFVVHLLTLLFLFLVALIVRGLGFIFPSHLLPA